MPLVEDALRLPQEELMMNAGDLMSKNLIAVRGDTPLRQVLRLMMGNRISGVPVLDEHNKLVGILTEGDLLRRVELGSGGDTAGWFRKLFLPDRLAADYVQTHGRRADELMMSPVVTVADTASLAEVAESMRRHHVRRVPVIRRGMVVGIVSRADLIRALYETLNEPGAVDPGDSAILNAITEELDRQTFLPRRAITVSVEGNVVGLDGVVFDVRQRDAAAVIAENLSGARPVENRLMVIEPNSGMIELDPAMDQKMALSPPGTKVSSQSDSRFT